MSLFTKLGNDIASPVDASGAPRPVENGDMQRWMTEVERILAVFQAGGGIIFPDLSTANASLAYNANQMAWVMGDPTPANNGVYRKIGASGTGSWARMGDLPFSMIRLDNAGAGTVDAIVATPMLPLPTTPGAALLTVNILAANTGNVTLNGKPLRTNSGNEIAPGGLTAGSIHAFLDLGDHFRLLSDQASAAIVAAAEAAQLAAEAARDQAEAIVGFDGTAATVGFDSTASGLAATNVQDALDELAGREHQFETIEDAEAARLAAAFSIFVAEGMFGAETSFTDAGTSDPSSPGQIEVDVAGVTHFYTRSNKILRPQQFGCKTGGAAAVNRAALEEMFALASQTGRTIDMGDANDIYEIDAGITVDWLTRPVIRGTGATIKLVRADPDGSPDTHALWFNATDMGIDLEGFHVDANDGAPNAFWIENNAVAYVEGNVHNARLVGVGGSNGYRRAIADVGGRGLSVRGWYNELYAAQCFCDGMKMAVGAGEYNNAGIFGVYIGRTTADAFPIHKIIEDVRVGKIASEDNTYVNDQDGLLVFDPQGVSLYDRPNASTIVRGGDFTDCWGRGMKLQAVNVEVINPTFRINSAPLTGGVARTNSCIDFQRGEGTVRGGRLLARSASTEHAVIGTVRAYAGGQIMVDGFTISGHNASTPALESIAYRYCDETHLIGSFVVKNCALQSGLAKNIAMFRSTAPGTERAIIKDNYARILSNAGVRLEGGGSNVVRSTIQDNMQPSSSVPLYQSSGCAPTVRGAIADNQGFSAGS